MRTAIIDKKDIKLKLENNSIKIDEQTIPFKLIDLLILNHRVILDTNDILKLTKNDISILLISYNNSNTSIINSANTKNAELKELQYNSLNQKLLFAKYFITKKIINHKDQLEENDINIDIKNILFQIENVKDIDELMGIEGAFARKYFNSYFELLPSHLHKSKRTKQPPRDPVNAVLSYWYSLYYNIITIKLQTYGIEPCIGYLHRAFRTHNALSSDIMEIFRSYINQSVLKVFKGEILSQEDFSKKGGVYLKYDGRKKIWSEFVGLVDSLKPILDDEIATLKKRINEANSNS